jgi:hypothetical protein
MLVRVSEVFGEYCVDPADGDRLCTQIADALNKGELVRLDFTGVQVLTSSFLNPALGCLYATFPSATLSARLSFEGLDLIDRELVDDVRETAMRFYGAPPRQRKQLLQATGSQFEY